MGRFCRGRLLPRTFCPPRCWVASGFSDMFYLVANNGPQAGRKYELNGDKWILGRHPDCHIVIEVGAVSRNHCQVFREGNDYKLEDLGSRNGTFVNDEPEKINGRRTLKLGDVVRVCEVSLTFSSDASQPASPAPPQQLTPGTPPKSG